MKAKHEMSDKERACSFTGHRPERLAIPEERVKELLNEQVEEAIRYGYTDFISGMQRDVDIWAAEEVLKLRNGGAPVRLIAACAFRGMEERWGAAWQGRYRRILDTADEVHFIGRRPGRTAYFERNRWMVDRSSRLIAVYTGVPGGTKETIGYAKKQGLDIRAIQKEIQDEHT